MALEWIVLFNIFLGISQIALILLSHLL